LFKKLATRHRQLARELHNDEVIAALLQLADECDEKAQELERRVEGEAAETPSGFKAGRNVLAAAKDLIMAVGLAVNAANGGPA